MYRKRDDLARLIHAMSGAEKRYFKSFSKAFMGDREGMLYTELFQMHVKGESKQAADFSGTSEKSLTMTKKRLYQNILKSLRLYNQYKSVGIVIQNTLSEVEILYNLGLANQSLFLLKNAYDLALYHEKFGLLLQVLEWESRLNVVLDTPTRPQEEIVAEEDLVLRKQRQYRFLENLYVKAETMKKKYGFINGEMRSELESATIHAPGMPSPQQLQSQKARFYYHFIFALYYWMTFQHQKAFDYSIRLVLPDVNSVPPGDYINGLLEHITSCVCLGKFNEALRGMEIGRAYIENEKLTQSHAFTARMFAYRSTYALIIYNYMGNVGRLSETIQRTEQELKHYDAILPFESKQVIIGNLMNAYMGMGDLAKADEIWEGMFNRHSQTVRRDIYADLHLFRLFSLLQSQRYSLLPSAAGAALRYYRRFDDAKAAFEVELPIALLLVKERDYTKPELLRELMEQISAIVTHFIAGLNGVSGFQEHYSRYVIWTEAILKGEPYYVAARRWYRYFRPGSA